MLVLCGYGPAQPARCAAKKDSTAPNGDQLEAVVEVDVSGDRDDDQLFGSTDFLSACPVCVFQTVALTVSSPIINPDRSALLLLGLSGRSWIGSGDRLLTAMVLSSKGPGGGRDPTVSLRVRASRCIWV
ncbi:hypothetical protein DBZ45_11155 [Arthrobacter globiformis]|uniref:Uncharacterized protein n=1 Tax=Arthrobacter globiformis TaxID=1665 RepID=A0A328HFM9_ARTGO|nr:hypothetical protein DBZ45_11155 [Arthrobacter globiformis]